MSDINHIPGCYGTAGCRCAAYEGLNPHLSQRQRAALYKGPAYMAPEPPAEGVSECDKCIGVIRFIGGEPWTCPKCESVLMVQRWTKEEIERAYENAEELFALIGEPMDQETPT